MFSLTAAAKFLPENDLYIPENALDAAGISEADFNEVIDGVSKLYAPIVERAGGKLIVERLWNNGTVNAYAEQKKTDWSVHMFGGLARHKTITKDGFALVICHEIGHHLAGAPRYSGLDVKWASNEGQADYFATTKCLRRYWQSQNNAAANAQAAVPAALTTGCNKAWSSAADRALCVRNGMAASSVSNLFAALAWNPFQPKFDKPDKKVVKSTADGHPASQCRLDTYFQGAMCGVGFDKDFDVKDPNVGACAKAVGSRPFCWFRPAP